MQNLPIQKQAKAKKDRNWKVECGKALLGFSYNNLNGTGIGEYNNKIVRNLEIVAGKFFLADYKHLINPYNLKGEQFTRFADKIRNYDIISPLFLKQIGNFLKSPFTPIVYSKNSNFENEKLEAEKTLINEMLQQKFINKLIQTGQIKEASEVEELSPDAITSKLNSIKDIKTETGQKIIDYIVDRDRLKMQYAKEFNHFLATNYCYSYATVREDNIIRYTVHPANIDHTYTDSLDIADASIIRCRYKFTLEDIIEVFQDHPDMLEYYPELTSTLESRKSNTQGSWFSDYLYNKEGYISNSIPDDRFDVYHTEWTSFRKVYTALNDLGEEIEVDEDYEGYKYDEKWREEIREIYSIQNEYFIGGDCVNYPIYDTNNKFRAKKSYCGIGFMHDLVQQNTLAEKIIGLQQAYNVVKFKIQTTVAKNHGKLGIIPMGLLINDAVKKSNTNAIATADNATSQEEMAMLGQLEAQAGLDANNPIAEALYRANASGLLLVDESSDSVQQAIELIKSLDLDLGQFINYLIQYAQSIKTELEEILGLNRYSTGDFGTREAASNVQEGLSQAGALIDLYYSFFEIYQANDLQRLLDLSKHAFKKGTNIKYMRTNQEEVSLQIPDNFSEASYGIFVNSSRKAQQVLNIMEQKATEFLQNGMQHGTMLKMISSTKNYSSIIDEVEKAEAAYNQRQQEMSQQEQQTQLQIKQMEEASKEADRELKKYEVDLNAEVKIQLGTMQAMSFESASNETEDFTRIEEMRLKAIESIRNFQISKKGLELKDKEIEAKKEIADKQLQIAKTNKQQ